MDTLPSQLTPRQRAELLQLAKSLKLKSTAVSVPPITRAERGERVPLSFAQQRLWFLAQMEGVSGAYHMPFGLRLSGELDGAALKRALDRIVWRHEALRTNFGALDGEPVQQIAAPDRGFELQEHDLRGHAAAAELQQRMQEEADRPFDLEHGRLVRGQLIRLAPQEHVLLITMHHIVSDGWSLEVFARELSVLYGAYRAGQPDPLPPLPIQYADYAVGQRLRLTGAVPSDSRSGKERQSEYWRRTLAGAPGLLELPTDRVRPAQQSLVGEVLELALDAELTRGLKALSRRHGMTLYMLVVAGWAAVLARLSGQAEVVIGTVTANRTRPEVEGLIGFFVNTQALRIEVKGSVAELLERVKARALEAQEHQELPFEQVVEIVKPVRSLAHAPIFQVIFAWQNNRRGTLQLPGLQAVPLEVAYNIAKFDLDLGMGEANDRIEGEVRYATALFDRVTIERHVGYLVQALAALVADEHQAVDGIDLLSAAERHQLLIEWNQTDVALPDRSLHALVEEQAERAPQAIAVVYEHRQLTYGELEQRANQLAHALQAWGVGPEVLVAICLERSLEMGVAVLAVLKAGGAYVPLDPAYPLERLAFMLADAGVALVLTQSELRSKLPASQARVLCLDREWDAIAAYPFSRPACAATSDNLAYVIYTSGSTGRPKGVLVPHAGLPSVARAQQVIFGVSPGVRVLQFASFGFDAWVLEFLTLAAGGTLVVPGRGVLLAGADLIDFLLKYRVDSAIIPPSTLASIPAAERLPLRTLVVGGEAFPLEVAARWSGHCRMWNAYGPTEITICASAAQLDGKVQKPPIGRPGPNARTYILDANQQPAPTGVAGELYIGGKGVTRGYRGRPDLTAERFVPDPFSGSAGARMYRSGDLVRYRADGLLDFLGRNDFQVKIRGFRIELGEIEARLAEHPSVREAVVLAREDHAGDKRLVAYVTAAAGIAEDGIDVEALRAHVSSQLPEYMVPAAYVSLAQFPLTPNGKLDRKALPAPDADAYVAHGYEEPAGEVETTLARIWAEVLKLERVGRNDHFFELGGHSLLVVSVISRLQAALGIAAGLKDLFAYPVLAAFAEAVRDAARTELSPITPVSREGALPLSFAQQRLWFLAQMEGVSGAYHMPFGLRLSGELDSAALKRALDRIVWRHEALRTNFEALDGEPVQRIAAPDRGFELQEHDLSGHAAAAAELQRRMQEEADGPFDLEHGRLVRGQLIRLAPQEHVLLITMHHIVSDGWSLEVFARELSVLYGAYRAGQPDPLPPLPIQYADYAVGQRQRLTGAVPSNSGSGRERQSEYWRRTLAGAPGLLELPTDRVRPAQQSFAGEVLELALDAELTRALKALSRRHGMTLYMLVVAGWAAVLARLSGQAEVVIGTVTANRTRPEVEALIGFFVNTLALRIEVKGSVAELLERVKARALEAQEHQELPFEQVVEIVKPVRSLAHAPIFQVLLAWQSSNARTPQLPGLQAAPVRTAYNVAKFDLDLAMGEVNEQIVGDLGYATALFDHATIERHVGYLRQALAALVADERQAVDRINLLSEAERRQILVEWNDTQAPYEKHRCIHEWIEAQAARQPQAIAVSDAHRQLSYADLNAGANRLAKHLTTRGVAPDALVAICLDRGVDLLIGMLAVLKAGGAYVPMDPSNPRQRLNDILEDAQPRVVLTQRRLRALLPPCHAAVIALDEDWDSISEHSPDNLLPEALGLSPSNLAYVIFTSGSTGRPKGVMIEHRSVVNLLCSMCAEPGIHREDRVLALTTVSFDIAAFELFLPLLVGAEVVFADSEMATDGWLMGQLIQQRDVTVLQATPATWRLLLEDKSWRAPRVRALSGGEALASSLASQVLERVHALWNGYGPTETTIYSTLQPITASSAGASASEPIGRPVANTRIYILDGHYEPAPIGVAGEIYIGGIGVGRGYLGKPDLTLQRFLPDPFSSEPGSRMYRTGDLARWRADGRIEFLGRNDFQVKLRGFRIELGEIEARLAEHPSVCEAVVLAREDHAGDKRLVAYITPATAAENGAASVDVEALRMHLSSQLPEYMVPAAYVSLAKLPLTASGKLDRKALPAPDADAYVRRGYEPPVGEIETTVARIWAEVINLKRVGRHDNFFELGGHSLLVVKVTSLLRHCGLETTVAEFFNHPTVESFAASLRNTPASALPRGAQRIRGGTQTPLFFVHDGFGDELYFFALARYLPKEWPVYGLPSVPPGEPRLHTMRAMAQRLVNLLQQVQANGPYRLAGWSFGGVLAYEIAQQLLDQGHAVEFLGLMDAVYLNGDVVTNDRETTPETRMLPDHFDRLSPQEARARALNWEIHSRAMAAYRPLPISIPVHLLVASERPPGFPELTASLGWERCVPAHLLCTQAVPGSHYSMMSPPYIETLGQRLTESLAAAVESKYVSEPVGRTT